MVELCEINFTDVKYSDCVGCVWRLTVIEHECVREYVVRRHRLGVVNKLSLPVVLCAATKRMVVHPK